MRAACDVFAPADDRRPTIAGGRPAAALAFG
jgi:hypothetical protein